VHEAGRPQLTQAGVDDREPGAALLPGAEQCGVLRPWKTLEAFVEGTLGRVRIVMQQVIRELTPAYLADETVGGLRRFRLIDDGIARRDQALARTDLTKVQVR